MTERGAMHQRWAVVRAGRRYCTSSATSRLGCWTTAGPSAARPTARTSRLDEGALGPCPLCMCVRVFVCVCVCGVCALCGCVAVWQLSVVAAAVQVARNVDYASASCCFCDGLPHTTHTTARTNNATRRNQAWAQRAKSAYPQYGRFDQCHHYAIYKKWRYQCTNPRCRQLIKRHSKSIDVKRQSCGLCGSPLELLGAFRRDGTLLHAASFATEHSPNRAALHRNSVQGSLLLLPGIPPQRHVALRLHCRRPKPFRFAPKIEASLPKRGMSPPTT